MINDDGGGSGIRTHDTVARIHAFQASAFSHSAIPPGERLHYNESPIPASKRLLARPGCANGSARLGDCRQGCGNDPVSVSFRRPVAARRRLRGVDHRRHAVDRGLAPDPHAPRGSLVRSARGERAGTAGVDGAQPAGVAVGSGGGQRVVHAPCGWCWRSWGSCSFSSAGGAPARSAIPRAIERGMRAAGRAPILLPPALEL